MTQQIERAIQGLAAKQSPKRRGAAKRLRKMRAVEAGPSLLTALEKEVRDPRTWETQYQMIMALGECGYAKALPTLERLAADRFEATAVYDALGDAIVRLSRKHDQDVSPVLRILRGSKNPMLINGAFRRMAMLRMVPDPEAIEEILAFVEPLPASDPLRFWVAAAAPGWEHPDLEAFFIKCEMSGRDDIANAAMKARARNYQQWRPL